MTPAELMKSILAAPVDLLWNGGIGTYVQASSEVNAEVGDRANDAIRAERHGWFYKYLTNPEAHGEMEPGLDIVFQKATRVLDFFALVNEVLGRQSADAGIVKSFLLYYYLWWRDEIMVPMRERHTIDTNDPKVKPGWWDPLVHLDRLAKR